MKTRKQIVLYLLSTLIVTSTQAATVSFGTAWQQLLDRNDKLKAGAEKVEQARGHSSASDSLNYPSLDITANYSYMEKPIELDLNELIPGIGGILPITDFELSEQDIFVASLNAMWPIYAGGKIDAAQSVRAAQVQEQTQQLVLDQRALFVTLAERYYGVILTQKLLNTQQQLKISLQQHLHHAELMEKQGQIATVERLSARVSYDKAVLDYNNSQRSVNISQTAFDHLLKTPQNIPTSTMFVLPQNPSLATMQQDIKERHPALLLLQAKQQQAKGLIEAERGGYKPTVFLYGKHTLYEDDTLLAEVAPDWVVGIGLKIPLLSRDGHGGKIRAANSALAQARYMTSQTQQDLQLLLQQSYNDLLGARDEVSSLNSTLELATENRRLRDIAFKQGLSTSLERVDAEIKLSGARIQQSLAEYKYVVALAKLSSIAGDIESFVSHAEQAGLTQPPRIPANTASFKPATTRSLKQQGNQP